MEEFSADDILGKTILMCTEKSEIVERRVVKISPNKKFMLVYVPGSPYGGEWKSISQAVEILG